jgi:hypothetical protein
MIYIFEILKNICWSINHGKNETISICADNINSSNNAWRLL